MPVGPRQNAHGVDLNRNFPQGWRRAYTSRGYYPGPVTMSEPETRCDRLRPDLVVSLHQAARSIDLGNPKTRLWAYRLAQAFHLPTRTVSCARTVRRHDDRLVQRLLRGLRRHGGAAADRARASMAGYYARAALKVGAMLVSTPTPSPRTSSALAVADGHIRTPTPSDTPTSAPAAARPRPLLRRTRRRLAETVGPSVAP